MRPQRLLAGTALLSAGSLLLEIALTRILSVLHAQSYVFLLLSVAVLGVGLGAALAALLPHLRREKTLGIGSSLASLSAFALILVLVFTMGSSRVLVLGVALVPYLFVGLTLATLFSLETEASSSLYGADLLGAGLGVVLAVPLLNKFGGLDASFLAAGVLALATLFFSNTSPLSLGLASLALLGVVGQLAFAPFSLEPRNLATPKPILEQLRAGGDVIETRWDAFARTDLVRRADTGASYLYMDGGAGSLVPDAGHPERWEGDIGSFPFTADAPQSAFIIGPGGGLDVALAQRGGVSDLTAVEVNRASIDIVQALGDYAGEVYSPEVTLYADEGRSVLRRSARDYDLIFLSQVITGAAEARGYALAENTLYTVEAFNDYLDHLSPDGQIALKLYDEPTLSRAMFTALQALSETGMSDAAASQHLLALLDTRATPPIPLLVVKKQTVLRDEAVRLARVAEANGYALLYVPGLLERPPVSGLATGQASLADLIAASAPVDLRPVRDDRPFFYSFERGVPRSLRPLLAALGIVVVLGVARVSIGQRGESLTLSVLPLLFAALGFGFMLLEITLIQRTGLFLGRPALALSLVLGTLLLGGGAGSGLAGRLFAERPWRGIVLASAAVSLMLLAWTLLWPTLSDALLAARWGMRASVTVLSLLPLALPLGMPFPLALRLAGAAGERQVALGWTLNGFASVLGSVAATALGVAVGFQAVALLALGSYVLIAFLALGIVQENFRHSRRA